MRYYIVSLLRDLFADADNKDVTRLTYKINNVTYHVYTILTNLYMLTDEGLVDFYTWCILNCYKRK